jgi:hypothetical protein
VDLEHRQRALGLARRQGTVAAGHRRNSGEALGKLATQPRRHAAAVRHARDEDASGVDADGGLELVERALERLDVVGAPGHDAAHVPEVVRPARRRIGDEEALAVGQPAEAGVVREVVAGLARAVQGDDERARLVGARRRVEEDLALALGRIDVEHVVARRQRGTWLVGGVGGVMDGFGAGLPRHEGKECETGDEGASRPRTTSGHAGTARAKTQPRQSTKVRIVTGGRTASSPVSRGRCSCPTAIATRAALSAEPMSWTAT